MNAATAARLESSLIVDQGNETCTNRTGPPFPKRTTHPNTKPEGEGAVLSISTWIVTGCLPCFGGPFGAFLSSSAPPLPPPIESLERDERQSRSKNSAEFVSICRRYTANVGNLPHMPREIVVDWITASGAGKVSVFMMAGGNTVASQRSALATFLGAVDAQCDNSTSWIIRNTGREMSDATGTLQGVWTDAPNYSGTGALTAEPVADATQALIRWQTGVIVNGRFLQGRTFIPGLGSATEISGNLSAAVRGVFDTAANALISAAVGMGVWHRPVLGAGGVFEDANTASTWNEFAILRRRRN